MEFNNGYHITLENNIDSIIKSGLIPMCGERSESIGDFTKAIYFYPALILTPVWVKLLYSKKDILNLKLLRFNLDNVNFIVRDPDLEDLYTLDTINPDRIQVLNSNFPLCDINKYSEQSFEWKNIKTLKK